MREKEPISWEDRDIGNLFQNKSKLLTDEEKYEWFKASWVPPSDFKFPFNQEGKKNRSFQYNWLKLYPWLTYSKKLNGGLCKCCLLFGKSEGGNNDVKLGKLVLEPLSTFKKAVEILKSHSNAKYHQNNVVASQNFLRVMEGKSHDVMSQMKSAEKALIEENKKKLIPIIKTVIFCGVQNIPLRGHRDDGDLKAESLNEGNFRALLKFRVDAGDEDLQSHLESCGKNSSYISKTIQNDLIQCCGEVITQKISTKIKTAKFFTIIADETTDSSIKEQLSVCFRYFDRETHSIKEDFIRFIDVIDLTGENICKTILNELSRLNLDVRYCRGQAFDGGSNMSGKFKGVQARITDLQPLARYTHCASHRLNLVISKACTVPSIRNAVGVISSIGKFFRESSGRLHALDEETGGLFKKGRHAVKKMCETRWIERHDAVLTFLEALPVLPSVFQKIAQSSSDGSNAFALLHCILSGEFLVSVVILGDILGLTLPLARKLQAENLDVGSAMELVRATTSSIQELRSNDEEEFEALFHRVKELGENLGAEIKKPRLAQSQRNRSNVITESAEEYFRINLYLPFLDFLLSELDSRFPQSQMSVVSNLQKLLNPDVEEGFEDSVLRAAEIYQEDLPSFSSLKGELNIWKHLCRSNPSDFPRYPAEAFKRAADLPNLQVLLQILCTLPVTSCAAERSFSCLRRLKTYLRTTMTEERLNGLALLHVHKDIAKTMTPHEVLEVFALKQKRKLSLKLC